MMASRATMRGFTLISFGLTCLLSAIVLAMALKSILFAEQQSLKVKAQRVQQENQLLAGRILTQAIAFSGIHYCGQTKTYDRPFLSSLDASLALPVDQQAVMVYAHQVSNSVMRAISKPGSGQKGPNSDGLKVEQIHSPSLLSTALPVGSGIIYLASRPDWKKKDLLLVDDCHHLALFRLVRIQRLRGAGTKLSLLPASPVGFAKGSVVSRLSIQLFYLGYAPHKNAQGQRPLALYVKALSGRRHELVRDIDELHFVTHPMKQLFLTGQFLDTWLGVKNNAIRWHMTQVI